MVQSCRKMFSQTLRSCSRADRPFSLSLSRKRPHGAIGKSIHNHITKIKQKRKRKKHMIKNSKRQRCNLYSDFVLVNELKFQPTSTNHVIIITFDNNIFYNNFSFNGGKRKDRMRNKSIFRLRDGQFVLASLL
jgi:hypothetical protein